MSFRRETRALNVADEVGEMLGRITFDELVKRAKEEDSLMYHI